MLNTFIFARGLTRQHSLFPRKGFVALALLATLSATGLLAVSVPLLPYFLGYHPPEIERLPVHCSVHTPRIDPKKPLKILNWNIQFLAGKYYPYWSDEFDQPMLTEDDIEKNLDKIIRVIREENPDIIQLQEVHRTHPLTHHRDQLPMLYEKLSDILPCYSSGTYWKARFIPSRYLTGEVEMSLVTMSRYYMEGATKELLPATRRKRVLVPFYPRHSLLGTHFPLQSGETFTAINTHLDSPTTGRGKIDEQIHAVLRHITRLTEKNQLWTLSGDFNLVPPGFHETLPENQKTSYSPYSPLTPFYKHFKGIPALTDVFGPQGDQWATAYDLNPGTLDLVIDYIFHPPYIQSGQSQVKHLPLDTSDHMPVITTLYLKEQSRKTESRSSEISPEEQN